MRTWLRVRFALAFFSAVNTASALAGTFDEADRLFAAREAGVAQVAAARAAYLDAMQNAVDADLAYGVQQIGRLAVYEGENLLAPDSVNKARKAEIFDECLQQVSRLEENAPFETYFAYWRVACNSLWMKFASVFDRLGRLSETKRYFNQLVAPDLEIYTDLGIDTRYEAGGVERVLSCIYTNSLSGMIRDGLPNGEKGLEMINRALAERPYPGSTIDGSDFYRSYRQKAEALIFLGRNDEAMQLLDTTIEEINEREADGDLPVGMEPETRGERTEMERLRNSLTH